MFRNAGCHKRPYRNRFRICTRFFTNARTFHAAHDCAKSCCSVKSASGVRIELLTACLEAYSQKWAWRRLLSYHHS